MKKIWLQPFPSYSFSVKQTAICILSGLIVFLIFCITQPFNINRLMQPLQLTYSLVYGAVTTLCLLLLTVVSPLVFSKVFDEEKWVVGKEVLFILITIVIIAAFNALSYQILENQGITFASFLKFLLATFFIGLVPISISVFFKQRVLLDKYRQIAQNINDQLLENKGEVLAANLETDSISDTEPTSVTAEEMIVLNGESLREKLELPEKDLWILATADNYINIIYRVDETIKTTLFRSTLTRIEDQVAGFDNIIRCHRGYIINISKVEKAIPTAQGLKLKLEQQEELIPVGKTYLHKIKERLQL
jgi:DNA-binding LytR/AlgR family response regulator